MILRALTSVLIYLSKPKYGAHLVHVVPGDARWCQVVPAGSKVVLPNVEVCQRYQLVLYGIVWYRLVSYGTVLSSWSCMVLYGYWLHEMVFQCGLRSYVGMWCAGS
jgi:hypothetical protein